MGKKHKGGRRMRHEEDDDDDEAASVASVETRIDEAIEELTEERTTIRISAMEKLTAYLLQCLAPEDVNEKFIDNVLGCLRKPSEGEVVLGSRILAILAITFGDDEERFFQRSKAVLTPMIKAAKNAKVKVAAIRALALICFISSVEKENADELLKLLETFFDPKILGDICKAALDSWGLVASSMLDEILASDDLLERLVPRFMVLLDHKDVEINSKKNSKKDRKTQRVVFRDIYSTLATGKTPTVSFTVKSEVLTITSWKSVKQFEAVKGCLQTGLQKHIKYNNVFRSMLDLPEMLEDRKVERSDVFDKKSTSRKQRSNELKGDRKRKQGIQDTFYDGDLY
ncbi:unnamed protein product [Peronospora belbahrii]|uniref:Interferon-related developmental regulator N-terminal domain-containing protein n=1 Tax=Peronospora belbahrii TaxID=622444 RepID=A0ABN8CP05_9STRA|nr:unnamed protein product [Peronospora belbahrii]